MSRLVGNARSGKKILFWLLIIVLLACHMRTLRTARNEGHLPLNDFIEYWSACKSFVSAGNPYSPKELLEIQRSIGWKKDQALMMWNPPWILPLLLPFFGLSYWTGRALWYLFSLISTFAIADWFWRRYCGHASHRYLSWIAVLLFIPAGLAFYLGQISPLLLLGLWGFLWALERNRLIAAGGFLMLLSVKPHVLYLFWFFLLAWVVKHRHWKILYGAGASFAALSLTAILVNSSIFLQYFSAITSSSGPAGWQTPTWGVAMLLLIPAVPWLRFIPSLIGLGIAGLLWCSWRNDFQWCHHLPTIVLLSITTASFTWTFDWIVFLPIIILIMTWIYVDPKRHWGLLLGLALILLLTILQSLLSSNYFYSIWLPPALWMVYGLGASSRKSGSLAAGSGAAGN
jgi:hypothetical protein